MSNTNASAKPAATVKELQQQVSLLTEKLEQKMSDEGYLQSLVINTEEGGKPEDLRVSGYVSSSNCTTRTKTGYINPADRDLRFVAYGDVAQQLLDAYRYKWTVIKYYGKKTARSTSVQMIDGELVAQEVGIQINFFDIKKQSPEMSDRPAPQFYKPEPKATEQAAPAAAPAPAIKTWDAAPLVPDTDELPLGY